MKSECCGFHHHSLHAKYVGCFYSSGGIYSLMLFCPLSICLLLRQVSPFPLWHRSVYRFCLCRSGTSYTLPTHLFLGSSLRELTLLSTLLSCKNPWIVASYLLNKTYLQLIDIFHIVHDGQEKHQKYFHWTGDTASETNRLSGNFGGPTVGKGRCRPG